MAAAAAALLRRSSSSAASFVTASFSLACAAFIAWTSSQVTPVDRLAAGQHLRQLDLQRIHARDVMHDHADLAPVLRERGLPLGVGERARDGGERAGALLETIGEGVRALAGCDAL